MSNSINPNIIRKKRLRNSADHYLKNLNTSNRHVLSEVLTIVESNLGEDQQIASEILDNISISDGKHSIRIGITGSPGVGKSSLIENLGLYYCSIGKKVAVLAIDPSSSRSDGSILGDKTRMNQLANHEFAFVRPSPNAKHLGGIRSSSRASVAICEKAGFDVILIESVGVGQSEIELSSIVDVCILMLLPGGGDDIQGIKRGIVEMADILVVNKADSDKKKNANESKSYYQSSISLFDHPLNKWKPPVLTISALYNIGIDDLYKSITSFIDHSKSAGYFYGNRISQNKKYIENQLFNYIVFKAKANIPTEEKLESALKQDQNKSIFKIVHSILDELENNWIS